MGTRAIVFTNVRSSVDEILNHLKQLAPMCRVGPTVSSVVDRVVALAALYLVCVEATAFVPRSLCARICCSECSSSCRLPRAHVWQASPFVGQASSGKAAMPGGDSNAAMNGQTQKLQQAVIDSFRRGDINVLVATCIGEEGLDIGAVDLVVFYDSVGSPIRYTWVPREGLLVCPPLLVLTTLVEGRGRSAGNVCPRLPSA